MKVSDSLSSSGRAGLTYFGTIGASFCHEMRNVVAALNENCGLLGDFVHAGNRGRPVDPERVERVNQRVARFVTRADDLLTRFSRLAHATDHEQGQADLGEIAQDVLALGGRIIASSSGEVQVSARPGISIHTSPFFARLLLWRCLAATLEDGRDGEPTTVTVAKTETGAEARLTAAGGGARWEQRGLPGPVEQQLCALAQCTMAVDGDTGALIIAWGSDEQ